MINNYQASCNQQLAFARFHLKQISTGSELSKLQQNACLQASVVALGYAASVYLKELSISLLGPSAPVVDSLEELSGQLSARGVRSAEMDELVREGEVGGWFAEISGLLSQSNRQTLFDSPEPVNAGLIATDTKPKVELSASCLHGLLDALLEFVTRQRSAAVEC